MTWPWVLGIAAAVVGLTFLATLAALALWYWVDARGDRARVQAVEFDRSWATLEYIRRIGGEQ